MSINFKPLLQGLLNNPEVQAERAALEQGALDLAVKLAESALEKIPVIGGLASEALGAAEPAIEEELGLDPEPGTVPAVDVGAIVRAELAKLGLGRKLPPAPTTPTPRVSPAGGPVASRPVGGPATGPEPEAPTPAQIRRQQMMDDK